MKLRISVTFRGIDGFEKYRPNVEIILCNLEQSGLSKFRLAINEAICNALRYGNGGIDDSIVRLNIRYHEQFIVAKISSDSPGFAVREYIEKLSIIDPQEWWEHLKTKNRGRGLWLMVTGSQKVIFNAAGNQVILAMRINGEPTISNLSKVYVLAN
ncbi:MAG: ATP-binding protein [Sporomusa sp.]